MLQDLAAITPPLVVCAAFLIGLAWLLRREMAPKRRAQGDRHDDPVADAGAAADVEEHGQGAPGEERERREQPSGQERVAPPERREHR